MRVLYVTYDGVLEGPARTQAVPYAAGLAARGHDVAFLSYEAPHLLEDGERRAAVEAELGDVSWTAVPRRGRQLIDLISGLRALRRVVRNRPVDLVHCRGYVPAYLCLRLRLPFLFDMRGFWPDERVDGGLWGRRSLGYRTWKRIERRLCERARGIVVLTERARDTLVPSGIAPEDADVTVIPTCADLERFRSVPAAERVAEAAGAAPRFLILGGTGTWYLPDAMLDLAARALEREPRAVLHVLTADPHEPLLRGLEARGIPAARRLVRTVPAASVPRWISGARAAIVLLRSTWSKGASSPTKLGELLGCGVPILMNAGIGDADRILGNERVGVCVTGFDAAAYDAALDSLDGLYADGEPDLRARCRALAERAFSLPMALERYEAAWTRAAGRSGG